MATVYADDVMTIVKQVTAMTYREQAVFYLNAFWTEGADAEAEEVYQLILAFEKEDPRKSKGNELNAVQAFHMLQSRNETLTALELKAQLRKADIDNNGEMGLAEYVIFTKNRDVVKFAKNPQGGNAESAAQMAAIEAQLQELQTQYDNLLVQLDEQKKSEAAAKQAEADAVKGEAKAKEEETAAVAAEEKSHAAAKEAAEAQAAAEAAAAKLKAAEDEVRKVEEEAKAVDAALKAEEDAFHGECARLEALTTDDTVGIVKRNMAVQQLAALKSSDPLPLKKAKITQEAVVRRVQKAVAAAAAESAVAAAAAKEAADSRAAADESAAKASEARASAVAAREAAEAQRAAAVAAREAAEEATKSVEASIESIKATTATVEEELAVLKAAPTVAHGAIWVAERDITEKKKYLPTRFQ